MTVKSLSVFDEYDNDFLYCEAIIKKHSKNFHTAFSQLPKDKASTPFADVPMMPSLKSKTHC